MCSNDGQNTVSAGAWRGNSTLLSCKHKIGYVELHITHRLLLVCSARNEPPPQDHRRHQRNPQPIAENPRADNSVRQATKSRQVYPTANRGVFRSESRAGVRDPPLCQRRRSYRHEEGAVENSATSPVTVDFI